MLTFDSIYEILTGRGEDLDATKEALADHGTKLDDHGAKLDEVLVLLRQLTGGSAPQA